MALIWRTAREAVQPFLACLCKDVKIIIVYQNLRISSQHIQVIIFNMYEM